MNFIAAPFGPLLRMMTSDRAAAGLIAAKFHHS
jgi:hypothetical protein